MSKPRRWIERMRLVPRDALHGWLLQRVALVQYIEARMWELEDINALWRLDPELAYEYTMNELILAGA